MDIKQELLKLLERRVFNAEELVEEIDKLYKQNQALQLQQTCVMQSVLFADWIVKKGYKLNQMNYSNNGGMWFINKNSIGCTTSELFKQFISETVA